MIEPVVLGDCTLYLGDCLEILPQLEAGSVDLTVTSPPYDNLRTYNGYVFNFEGIAQELYRVTKPGGVVVWVVGDATENGNETGTSFRQALYFKEIGFNLFDTMFYRKNISSYPANRRYEQVIEYMFVLSIGYPNTVNLIRDKKNRWAGTSNFGERSNRQKDGTLVSRGKSVVADFGIRTNVWEYSTGAGYSAEEDYAYDHPAIFPEALARDHILSWSNEGDTILDPMMGSGTTGKMATKYNRRFIGCEISEQYFDISVKRIKEAQLQMRLPI